MTFWWSFALFTVFYAVWSAPTLGIAFLGLVPFLALVTVWAAACLKENQ